MPEKIVSQDSKLGNVGLLCLLEKGFCGPNYDLSEVDVHVIKFNEDCYNVSFWDMSCCVNHDNKYYDRLSSEYRKYSENQSQ